MDISFDQYLEVFNGIVNQSPWCFGSRASAASETVRLLGEQGYNGIQLNEHYETHRKQTGKLWNYTGD